MNMNRIEEFYLLKKIYEGLGIKGDSAIEVVSTNINLEGEKQPKLKASQEIHIKRYNNRKIAEYIDGLLKGQRTSDDIKENICNLIRRKTYQKLNELKAEIKRDFNITDKEFEKIEKHKEPEGGIEDHETNN